MEIQSRQQPLRSIDRNQPAGTTYLRDILIQDYLTHEITRMHSSRMRTARSSSRHGVGVVFAWRPPSGVGLGPPVWAWRPPPGVGLETPSKSRHLPPTRSSHISQEQEPPGPPRTGTHPSGQTDTCKNIIFANFVCGG